MRPFLLALLFCCPPALAVDSLLPTDLHAYGDCVTPRIMAPSHALQSRIDRDYCVDGNWGDAEKIQQCLHNTATRQEVTFFWDNCGSEDGPFEISLGGTQYTLTKVKRVNARKVPVAGHYEAPGLQVTIEPGRLLRRSRLPLAEGGDEAYEVLSRCARGLW